MNEKQAELTSALLDGELDGAAERQVVTELLQAQSAGMDRYARYRLIGDAMRGDAVIDASTVATRVRVALEDEPVVLAPSRSRAPRWIKPVTGAALAASVAAAAIVIAPSMMTAPAWNTSFFRISISMIKPQIVFINRRIRERVYRYQALMYCLISLIRLISVSMYLSH